MGGLTKQRSDQTDTLAQGAKKRRATPGRSPVVAVVVGVLVLGGAGAAAAWYFDRPVSVSDDEGSPRALATNALGTARNAAAFFRDSATRDFATLATLLRRSADGDADANVDEVGGEEDGVADGGAPAAATAPPPMGPTIEEWMSGAPGPTLTRNVELPASAAVPLEAPLFMVFDSGSPGVSPPGTQDIRVRHNPFPGVWITDAASVDSGLVEVVVGATGDVESAKLISTPLNVHESMLLSAVKTWRFRPAQKDGQAVRYRQRLHIAAAR